MPPLGFSRHDPGGRARSTFVFAGVALGYGRGWGFAYVLVACLAVLAQALIVRPSGLAFWFDLLVYLPLFLYCGLRLFGSLGPPTGGLELRRHEP